MEQVLLSDMPIITVNDFPLQHRILITVYTLPNPMQLSASMEHG